MMLVPQQRVRCGCEQCALLPPEEREHTMGQWEVHTGAGAAKKWKTSIRVVAGGAPDVCPGGCGGAWGRVRVGVWVVADGAAPGGSPGGCGLAAMPAGNKEGRDGVRWGWDGGSSRVVKLQGCWLKGSCVVRNGALEAQAHHPHPAFLPHATRPQPPPTPPQPTTHPPPHPWALLQTAQA